MLVMILKIGSFSVLYLRIDSVLLVSHSLIVWLAADSQQRKKNVCTDVPQLNTEFRIFKLLFYFTESLQLKKKSICFDDLQQNNVDTIDSVTVFFRMLVKFNKLCNSCSHQKHKTTTSEKEITKLHLLSVAFRVI